MKRLLILALAAIMVFTMAACTGGETSTTPGSTTPTSTTPSSSQLKDGTYKAEVLAFDNGYKYFVELTIAGGKITAAVCDAVNPEGTLKSTLSKEGKYDMKNDGLKWHEQADAFAAKLVEVQDPLSFDLDDTGHTDAVSGVTIHVNEFVELAVRALRQAAGQPQGEYKDGSYKAEAADFDQSTGYKDVVELTVRDGLITEAKWNATHKDGGKTKVERSISGEYDMKNGDGLKWHEQAEAMQNELLIVQNPAKIAVASDGYTDAVSGVTVHVSSFVQLAEKALEGAK